MRNWKKIENYFDRKVENGENFENEGINKEKDWW